MKTIKLTWSQYIKLVDKLVLQIKKSNKVYKAVYSPDNPMLSFLLGKKLEIKILDSFDIYLIKESIELDNEEYKDVIIVSDNVDVREQYKEFDFACLFYNQNESIYSALSIPLESKFYFVNKIDKNTKVVMPWEIIIN